MRASMDVLPERMTLTFGPREIRAVLGSSSADPGQGVAESNPRVFAECVIHCYPINVCNMNLDQILMITLHNIQRPKKRTKVGQ